MLDLGDDDEIEFVSAQDAARLKGHAEIARSISDWKQQKPFEVFLPVLKHQNENHN